MARMTIKTPDEYALKLSNLGKESIEIAKKAVIAGAVPVEKEIRKKLESVVSEDSTGELERSLGTAPPLIDRKGNVNTKIGFAGYDRNRKPTPKYPNGIPNALKARAIESGTSTQRKKPFIRPAVNKSKSQSIQEIERVVNQEIERIMK